MTAIMHMKIDNVKQTERLLKEMLTLPTNVICLWFPSAKDTFRVSHVTLVKWNNLAARGLI